MLEPPWEVLGRATCHLGPGRCGQSARGDGAISCPGTPSFLPWGPARIAVLFTVYKMHFLVCKTQHCFLEADTHTHSRRLPTFWVP